MKHANISFFIPHIGCPHTCSFCNQRAISGVIEIPTKQSVTAICTQTLKNNPKLNWENTEIAFFGGSFTAIDHEYMCELLQGAYTFVKNKQVKGIRVSTRPDAINLEVLSILKKYGVTAIELGAQSMNDNTLQKNGRGHTAKQVKEAAALIKENGFSLGLQMMIGLFGDEIENNYQTAQDFVQLQPDTVRIYPTLVLEQTDLAKLYKEGKYEPLSLEQAIAVCKKLLKIFYENKIEVIKLGLHPDQEMQTALLAGPFHPAFRQLVESALCLEEMEKLLSRQPKGTYILGVSKENVSNYIGQKRENIKQLAQLGYQVKVFEVEKPLEKLCILL